jgi:CheY-like chemotaxis protein
MLQEEISGFHTANEPWQGSDPTVFSSGSQSAEPQIQRRKVLVVDDEKRIADTLCEILRAYEFDAVAAYDGWAALRAIPHFAPDYLLSDVLMPHMNGVELAIAARNICSSVKILLFSGQAGIADILESGKQRGFTFPMIAKPIHPLKLLEQLKEL